MNTRGPTYTTLDPNWSPSTSPSKVDDPESRQETHEREREVEKEIGNFNATTSVQLPKEWAPIFISTPASRVTTPSSISFHLGTTDKKERVPTLSPPSSPRTSPPPRQESTNDGRRRAPTPSSLRAPTPAELRHRAQAPLLRRSREHHSNSTPLPSSNSELTPSSNSGRAPPPSSSPTPPPQPRTPLEFHSAAELHSSPQHSRIPLRPSPAARTSPNSAHTEIQVQSTLRRQAMKPDIGARRWATSPPLSSNSAPSSLEPRASTSAQLNVQIISTPESKS